MSRQPFAMSAHAMRVLETIQAAGPIPLREIDVRCGDAPGETLRGTTISLMRTGHLGAAMSSDNKVREYFLTAKGRSVLRREPDLDRPLRIAGPREAAFSGCYVGSELLPYTGRPGANDSLALPSRFGNQLRYRDGRTAGTRPAALSPCRESAARSNSGSLRAAPRKSSPMHRRWRPPHLHQRSSRCSTM